MKLKTKLLLFLSVICQFSCWAQDTLLIHYQGKVIYEKPIAEIDSIRFGYLAPIDGSGNPYSVIQIGSQSWLSENLRTSKFNDHSSIEVHEENSAWVSNYYLTTQKPVMCWFNNDSITNFTNKYGALYNWYAVKTNKLCPLGWHVANSNDWAILVNFLGGADKAGEKLKSRTGWMNQLPETNSTSFNALPGGYRDYNGNFCPVGPYGGWWSSSNRAYLAEWIKLFEKDQSIATKNSPSYYNAYSVRCVKD
jgi:uncharacterized protein (TIGR02145 family)